MKDIKTMISVMQAYADGKKIEALGLNGWKYCPDPIWNWYSFDYRIKPEPKYRPYANADECFADVQKHGGWVKDRYAIRKVYQITFKEPQGMIADLVHVEGTKGQTYEELLRDFVWADDGSSVGVLKEEEYEKRNNRTLPW